MRQSVTAAASAKVSSTVNSILPVKCQIKVIKVSNHTFIVFAARLRRKTTLTVREIAQLLRMGKTETLNSNLYHWRKSHEIDACDNKTKVTL